MRVERCLKPKGPGLWQLGSRVWKDLVDSSRRIKEGSDSPRGAGGLMSWTASKAVGHWFRRRAQARLLSTVQNDPLAPSALSCSRMYWRTCSNSNPTVDTA